MQEEINLITRNQIIVKKGVNLVAIFTIIYFLLIAINMFLENKIRKDTQAYYDAIYAKKLANQEIFLQQERQKELALERQKREEQRLLEEQAFLESQENKNIVKLDNTESDSNEEFSSYERELNEYNVIQDKQKSIPQKQLIPEQKQIVKQR